MNLETHCPTARDGEATGARPKRRSRMQTIDPLVTALVAMCVGALMVQAGVAKRMLVWRPRRPNRERRRRP
jgi:hypothetical protein